MLKETKTEFGLIASQVKFYAANWTAIVVNRMVTVSGSLWEKRTLEMWHIMPILKSYFLSRLPSHPTQYPLITVTFALTVSPQYHLSNSTASHTTFFAQLTITILNFILFSGSFSTSDIPSWHLWPDTGSVPHCHPPECQTSFFYAKNHFLLQIFNSEGSSGRTSGALTTGDLQIDTDAGPEKFLSIEIVTTGMGADDVEVSNLPPIAAL